MRIKSVLIMLIFIFIFAGKTFAIEYYEIDNKDRTSIIENAYSEWMESFKKDDVPEEQRILEYKNFAMSMYESNEKSIRASVEFVVTPVSEENTIWNKNVEYLRSFEENGDRVVNERKTNICFLRMTNVNGKYQLDYIGTQPEDYGEFLERYEEYKKLHPNQEKKSIKTEEIENATTNNELETINKKVIIVSSIILAIIFIIVVVKCVRFYFKRIVK